MRLAGHPNAEAWTVYWIELEHEKLDGRWLKDCFKSRATRLRVYAVVAADVAFQLFNEDTGLRALGSGLFDSH